MKIQSLLLAFTAFFCVLSASAQLKIGVTNNDLRNNLEKVVSDFPNHLANLRGEMKAQNPQSTEFTSTLDFKGAEENLITQFAGAKPVYSWQATLLTVEEFEDAAKKYKWLCNQLKSMTLRLGDYSFSLEGRFDQPDESKKFSGTIFQLTPSSVSHPKLKIEAGLQYYFPEWKVTLTVYEKEREDDEQGEIRDR